MPRDVLLAAIVGAQGLKGEVRLKTFTATPEALSGYGVLHAKDGQLFTLAVLRAGKNGKAVASFREVADRSAAEALKGTELFVARAALPPAEVEEYYHADLVGLTAEDTEGRRLGKIAAIHNYGASDVLVIACDDDDEILIAFTRENVPEIDVKSGRVVVAVPEEDEAEGNVE